METSMRTSLVPDNSLSMAMRDFQISTIITRMIKVIMVSSKPPVAERVHRPFMWQGKTSLHRCSGHSEMDRLSPGALFGLCPIKCLCR
jgi:hypothetical protein